MGALNINYPKSFIMENINQLIHKQSCKITHFENLTDQSKIDLEDLICLKDAYNKYKSLNLNQSFFDWYIDLDFGLTSIQLKYFNNLTS